MTLGNLCNTEESVAEFHPSVGNTLGEMKFAYWNNFYIVIERENTYLKVFLKSCESIFNFLSENKKKQAFVH